jgi:hypothetical protein
MRSHAIPHRIFPGSMNVLLMLNVLLKVWLFFSDFTLDSCFYAYHSFQDYNIFSNYAYQSSGPSRIKNFHFTILFRQAPGPTQPHIQQYRG